MDWTAISPVLQEFLKIGIAGAVAIVCLWHAWRKDREATRAYLLLIEKLEHGATRQATLTAELNSTIRMMTDNLQLEEGKDPDGEASPSHDRER